ncbi:glycosyltransferase [Modestobacter muralis]|uniref:Glycosyltransferase n=1 Tax=Modestobacter muralis TaxID=1608614 RepID=A0A6P0HBS6_9ACTN|nr:glycosyltransferase [Modestobacter muralis]NEN53348.1 glycosyltransferase [Modestobacter muralis]
MSDSSLPPHGVQVVVVDAGPDLPALDVRRPDGTRWSGVWLVVRVAGAPVALVEVDLAGRDVLPADELRRAVDPVARAAAPRPVAVLPDDVLPSISVVVPTDARRPDQLRECLAALAALQGPGLEVLVVDNSQGAEREGVVAAAAAGLPGVRVVREPVPGISAARNAGVAAARGEVVAFTDDDVQVDPDWLRALATRFARQPDVELVTGLILPGDLETDAQLWFERHYGGFGGTRQFAPLTYRGRRSASPLRRSTVAIEDATGARSGAMAVYGAGRCGAGANFAVRTATLRRLGGFDPALGAGTPARGGEDLALFIAHLWAGGAIGYEPTAVVFHAHRADEAGLRAQLHGYGLGYTAMLTALVARDPRHLLGLAAQVAVQGAGRLHGRPAGTPDPTPSTVLGPPPPADLGAVEQRAKLLGPAAWVRSRRAAGRAAV